jgi:serine protease Do
MIKQIKRVIFALTFIFPLTIRAEIPNELIYNLKATIVKVRSVNQAGGKSLGTGVVVAENKVATNCHVIADAIGIDIHAMGEGYQPVALQADWRHDVCILDFQFLPLKPAVLGDSENLRYEEPIFSIGFPGGAPKPLTTFGSVKALYPFEGSNVIRISTSFQMGASGSPLFNERGEVIGLSTFKSPGRLNAFYYNVPIKWVKEAMNLPQTDLNQKHQHAFWEAELDKKPYWMQIVIPLQNEDWQSVERIVKEWISVNPKDQEARFYNAVIAKHASRLPEAKNILKNILVENPYHASALAELADIAASENNLPEVEYYKNQLAKFSHEY